MNGIDKGLMAIALYVVFSAFFSLVYSMFSGKHKGKKEQQEVLRVSTQELSRSKKEKIIKPGFTAFCNVCERSLETDTYLKNHLEGQKHLKKAKNFTGDVYTLKKNPR